MKEFEEYNYLLDNVSWKEELPTFRLYRSEIVVTKPKVSVIIANYNNKPYLVRMMDSLVGQTLGIHRVQVMFIDDRSTDNSLHIVMPYINKYPNIEIYHLAKNTGGAYGPRNVGILNARGEYLVFLDADDWYDVDGLKVLSDLLDKSGDGIVFGGILCSSNGRLSHWIPSYIEANRVNYPINKLSYDFYSWLGPQGNMVRASLVLDNNLHFIKQRVADDVIFFLQVLRLSETISQTKELTTYLNRDDSNDSLSKSVNETFMLSWLRALSYIKNNFEEDIPVEKFLARRLELLVMSFSMKWDTEYGFSREKVANFVDLLKQYLGELPIYLGDYFKFEDRKIVWKALIEKNFDFIVKFNEWNSLPFFDKKLELIDGVYYYVSDDPEIPNVEVSVRIEGNTVNVSGSKIIIDFSIYTTEEVYYCELRNNRDPWDCKIIKVSKLDDIHYQAVISREIFEELKDDEMYRVFIRTTRFHNNPILINEIECLIHHDTVIRNFNGYVAIEKRGVEKGNYLVINEMSDEVVIKSNNKATNSCVNVVGSSFLSNGKFAMLTDEGVRVTMDFKYIRKISNRYTQEELNLILKKFNIQLGVYKAEEELIVYNTPMKSKKDIHENVCQGGLFNANDILIRDDKEMKVFFEIELQKYVLADKKLAKKIDRLEDYFINSGFYIVKTKGLEVFESPDLKGTIIKKMKDQELVYAIKIVLDKTSKGLMFGIEEGYISAKKKNLEKYGKVIDRGIHQTGVNFIVMADELPIYKVKELGKSNLNGKTLTKGELFEVRSFNCSCSKEASLEIEGIGFVSAKRELTERVNDKLDLRTYNVKSGRYIIIREEEKGYRTPSFVDHLKARRYEKGTIVNAVGFGISRSGYPRLKLGDGNYVTSNSKFIKFQRNVGESRFLKLDLSEMEFLKKLLSLLVSIGGNLNWKVKLIF